MKGVAATVAVVVLFGVPPAWAESPSEPRAPGEGLYAANCSVCHGVPPNGEGPAAGAMFPPQPDLTDPVFWKGLSDARLIKNLRVGMPGTPMPSFNHLSQSELSDLVTWLRAQVVEPPVSTEPAEP